MGLVGCFAVTEDVGNMQDGNRVGTAVELTNTQCKSGDSGHAEAKNNAAIFRRQNSFWWTSGYGLLQEDISITE
jgi:hypothetical protein